MNVLELASKRVILKFTATTMAASFGGPALPAAARIAFMSGRSRMRGAVLTGVEAAKRAATISSSSATLRASHSKRPARAFTSPFASGPPHTVPIIQPPALRLNPSTGSRRSISGRRRQRSSSPGGKRTSRRTRRP